MRRVVVEFIHADGRTDGHDESNSRFSHFCESAYKREITWLLLVTVYCYKHDTWNLQVRKGRGKMH